VRDYTLNRINTQLIFAFAAKTALKVRLGWRYGTPTAGNKARLQS
jgi:hypothetical protein